MGSLRVLAIICVCVIPVSGIARGQSVPADDAREEARERFARATELYEEGLLEQALEEFRRVYEVAPTPQVLYNLGQVYAALGRAVEAVDTFTRYMADAGESVSAERRELIDAELRRQRARIAFVTVSVDVPRATVLVDGLERGPITPEPLAVTSGTVLIEVIAAGYEPFRTTLRLAGGVRERVEAALVPLAVATGRIRISASRDGAEVRVDDEVVGVTPLQDTIAVVPGVHRVEVRASGYRPVLASPDVAAGEQEEVNAAVFEIDHALAGRLVLQLPETPSEVTVDGASVEPAAEYVLTPGVHTIGVQVSGRAPYRGSVSIATGETLTTTPILRWSDEAARIESNRAAVQAGWITLGVGVGIWVATIPLFGVLTEANIRLANARTACGCQPTTGLAGWAAREGGWWALAAGATGVGLLLDVIALPLLLGANNDSQVRDGASLRVAVGAGTLELRGAF